MLATISPPITKGDGSTCTITFTKFVSCPHGGPVMRVIPNSNLLLTVVPNPAHNDAMVTYNYGTEAKGATRTLEFYDMTGRRLNSFQAGENAGGVWKLDLNDIAAGIYQIVMKERGNSVATIRLSITR